MEKRNIGILASINWNSKKWADYATKKDIDNSKFAYVIEYERAHEDLNFGHEKFPIEKDGYYIGYTSMFNKLPSVTESKYVDIIFFKSHNHKTKKNYIVGFYAFPIIGDVLRKAIHDYFDEYNGGNFKSVPEHILLLKNPIEISNEINEKERYLPFGKLLGQQGFNYLTKENVFRILDKATQLNPEDKKLKSIKFKILKENN